MRNCVMINLKKNEILIKIAENAEQREIVSDLKKKIIDLRAGVVVIIVGVVGATIGAIISSKMNVNLLKKFFGIFLLIIAIYEIYSWYKMYIKKKIRHTKVKK